MITEDYVSFEIAKLLKEKGFLNPCLRVYDNKGIICIRYTGFDVPHNYLNRQLYLCPTHQMAMKWLREVHGLNVETFSIKGTSNVCLVFWKGNVVKLLTQDRVFNGELVGSYEEAVEATLKYVLENLI